MGSTLVLVVLVVLQICGVFGRLSLLFGSSTPLLIKCAESPGPGEPCSTQGSFAKPTLKFNVYWVRHGFSCANVLQKLLGADQFAINSLQPDTCLTLTGIKQAVVSGQMFRDYLATTPKLPTPEFYLTSQAKRAIETATYFAPAGTTIIPVPGVSEHSIIPLLTLDNLPATRTQQQSYFCRADSALSDDKCASKDRFSVHGKSEPELDGITYDWSLYKDGAGTDFHEFLKGTLYNFATARQRAGQTEFTFVVVSHSNSMSQLFKYFGSRSLQIENTAVFLTTHYAKMNQAQNSSPAVQLYYPGPPVPIFAAFPASVLNDNGQSVACFQTPKVAFRYYTSDDGIPLELEDVERCQNERAQPVLKEVKSYGEVSSPRLWHSIPGTVASRQIMPTICQRPPSMRQPLDPESSSSAMEGYLLVPALIFAQEYLVLETADALTLVASADSLDESMQLVRRIPISIPWRNLLIMYRNKDLFIIVDTSSSSTAWSFERAKTRCKQKLSPSFVPSSRLDPPTLCASVDTWLEAICDHQEIPDRTCCEGPCDRR